MQGKLSALAGAVQYQELSDPAVWDACGAMDDCAAILKVRSFSEDEVPSMCLASAAFTI